MMPAPLFIIILFHGKLNLRHETINLPYKILKSLLQNSQIFF